MTPPPVPEMVTVQVPGVALVLTVRVSVDAPEPGAAMVDGLKAAVTPVGRPLADRATALLNPPDTVDVIVEVPLAPCFTVTDAGLSERAKVAVVKVKHWVRLPVAGFPSRGGNGAPFVELLVSGVLLSKVWLMEARVGSP